MMLSKAKRLIGVAAAAVAVSAALPAPTAGAALAPCRAVSQSTGSEVAIVLEGQYVDKSGGDVVLTCYLVQNGVRVASARDPLVGPVAVLASDQRLSTVPFTVCYTVSIRNLVTWSSSYYSNC